MEKFDDIIAGRKRFNNKPYSHWEQKAQYAVVDWLVRAALNTDTRCLPGKLAHDRLMELAKAENPELVKEVLGDVDRFQRNIARVVSGLAK